MYLHYCNVILKFSKRKTASIKIVRVMRKPEYLKTPSEHSKRGLGESSPKETLSRWKFDGWMDIMALFWIIEWIEHHKAFDFFIFHPNPMQHPIAGNNTCLTRYRHEGIQIQLPRGLNNWVAPVTSLRRKDLPWVWIWVVFSSYYRKSVVSIGNTSLLPVTVTYSHIKPIITLEQ